MDGWNELAFLAVLMKIKQQVRRNDREHSVRPPGTVDLGQGLQLNWGDGLSVKVFVDGTVSVDS